MSKYSFEFKLEVVMFCMEGNYGYRYTAKHFNIPAVSDVRKWVRKYKEHGMNGLSKNSNISYDGVFKQNVVAPITCNSHFLYNYYAIFLAQKQANKTNLYIFSWRLYIFYHYLILVQKSKYSLKSVFIFILIKWYYS